MSAHTPGPWIWNDDFLVGGDGSYVCDDGSACGEYSRVLDPDSPNARLIAAAPDLLAALKAALAIAPVNADDEDDPEQSEAWAAVRAAIAKAEGRTP